jgi:F0F1-type ATP synthase gamma subunit
MFVYFRIWTNLELDYHWNLQVGEKEAPKELYVAMTSDRGLAGAVHSSICKAIRYRTCFFSLFSQIQVLNFAIS